MKIDKLMIFVIMCIVVFGGALIILSVAEDEDKLECKSPYLRIGDRCCIDSDFNNICDSYESTDKIYSVIDQEEYLNQLKQMNQVIKLLREDIHYSKEQKDYYPYDRRDYDSYQRSYYNLAVTVKDDLTEDPVINAYIQLRNQDSDKTSSSGRAIFYDLREGCYELKITHPEYKTEYKDICMYQDRKLLIYLR